MAKSTITVTFTGVPALDALISFQTQLRVNPTGQLLYDETIKATRLASYQVNQGENPVDQANEYADAFTLDYSGGGVFSVVAGSPNTNDVLITLNDETREILNFVSTDGNVSAIINNPPSSTYEITNELQDEYVADSCNFTQVEITTDVQTAQYTLNGDAPTPVGTNPFIVILPRSISNSVELENAGGDVITWPATGTNYVDKLAVGNVNIVVQSLITGATVTVNIDFTQGLILEYSLDGTNWQSSNVFTGQAEGNYTMHIRDGYGCSVTKDYEVTATGTRAPYFFVSQANSIGFVEQVDWNGCSVFKNDGNTLAFEALKDINGVNYCLNTLFQTCDSTTIQFHTNFENSTVTLRKDGEADVDIPIVQHSNNINVFSSMDCWIHSIDDQMALYFESGNVYNEMGDVIDNYTLNGNLPDMAIIGNLVTVDGQGTFQIIDLFYDETSNKKVMLLNTGYVGGDAVSIATSVYDILPFEVMEFTINWGDYGPGLYDVVIDSDDSENGQLKYLSENIDIADIHYDTLAIRYYNDNNKDIFYKYGIENFIRIPYLSIEGLVKDTNEINIGDLIATVINSEVYDVDSFQFAEVIKSVMIKLVIALSSEFCFIQGVGYIKDGSVDTGKVQGTNLYAVKCDMVKTNITYTNNRQGQGGANADGIPFDIPTIITAGTEFIKA